MMRTQGPLVLVEDDSDDQEIIVSILKNLGLQNDVKLFHNGEEALNYLYEAIEEPFLILSDINMPIMDGIAFKKTIDNNDFLKKRCIPFIFLSTSPTPFVKQI